MTRYFYDDLQEAAWMADKFGLTLADESGEALSFVPPYHFHIKENGSTYHGRYYIHPDSVPMLEPREGDLIRDNFLFFEIDSGTNRNGCCDLEHAQFAKTKRGWGVLEIIQRDNKAFHWPEVER